MVIFLGILRKLKKIVNKMKKATINCSLFTELFSKDTKQQFCDFFELLFLFLALFHQYKQHHNDFYNKVSP